MATTSLLGIDFGTTNSTMAQAVARDRAEVVLDAEGLDKVPSLVFYGQGETLVGTRAKNYVVDANGDSAVESRLIRCIKRNMLNPPVIGLPDGRTVRPPEVAAEILGKLRRDAETADPGTRFTRAVIACPAMFDGSHGEALLEAAHLTGFEEVEILEEPVAAALAFDSLGGRIGKGVLVFDFGGGTFDAAFVVREPGESTFHLALEPDGDAHCGGEDLDQALYEFFDEQARERFGRTIAGVEGAVDFTFLDRCRHRKEHLSRSRHVTFSVQVGEHSFRTSIDRSVFEDLVRDPVERAVEITCRLAERAAAERYPVDTVLLVGGSSQVPLVKRQIQEQLGIDPLNWGHRDVAVALGSALHAAAIWMKGFNGATAAAPPPVPTTARNLIRRGDGLRQRRDIEEAIAQYDQALAIAPEAIEALAGRGESRLGLHRLDAAVSDFDAALRLDSGFGRALVGRARANTERYRTEESMADLALALAIDPDDSEALVARGWAYSWSERDDEAAEDFNRALALDPGCADALAGRGFLVMSTDGSQATADFQRALELDPTCLWARLGGPMVNWDADPGEAATGLEGVFELDPGWPLALALRGVLHAARDDFDGACAEWELALEINPDEAVALGLRGLIHAMNERHDEASADLERAIELAPWWGFLAFFRGIAASQRGDHEAAVADYDLTLRLDPQGTSVDLADVLGARGAARLELDDVREGLADVHRAIELAPDAERLLTRAGGHIKLEDYDAALADAAHALRLAPGSEEVRGAFRSFAALRYLMRANVRRSQPAATQESLKGSNRLQLERAAFENNWHGDQKEAVLAQLNGTEELIWLGRCARTTDVMRQVALLVTSERLLWCRGTVLKGPSWGYASWAAIDSVEDAGNGFRIKVSSASPPIDLGFNQFKSGTDWSGHGLVRTADDLRALVRMFRSFHED